MVGYVYFLGSLIINGKIDIVDYIEIDDNSKKIVGRSNANNLEQVTFDGGSEFIVLESDNINKSSGDTINLTGLIDCRNYFLKGKDFWYQEQIKKANETITNLNQLTDMYGQTLDSIMFDILPNINTTTTV